MKKLLSILMIVFLIISSLPVMVFSEEQIPAFPGAEGGGMYTTGGRGGEVYEVTNLEDSGPGSLRDAVSQSNVTIVFRVSGTIHLKTPLRIDGSNITIAGQTAPGDGICVAGHVTWVNGSNIIIRYMRFRPGSTHLNEEPDGITATKKDQHDIILDHVSSSWSTDEALSFYHVKNLTVQWSIISESLTMSGHFKGKHGYGGIWGGIDATFHHNLLAHHTSRNPRVEVGGNTIPANIDMKNNVIYNWQFNTVYGGDNASINIVNNYFKPGPGTQTGITDAGYDKTKRIANPIEGLKGTSQWYLSGNIVEGAKDVTEDNSLGFQPDENSTYELLDSAVDVAGSLKLQSAAEAYQEVLSKAGAVYPKRDEVDARVVNDVKNGTGRYLNLESEVGGWPELKSAKAPVDSDHDGMPDAWEKSKGLNADDPADGKLDSGDGYTNLEKYLNSLVDMDNKPQNPQVKVTAPAIDTVLASNSSMVIKAEAAAGEKSTIEKVEFYDADSKLGESTKAPYTFTFTDVPEGYYLIHARAVDNKGLSTRSGVVPVYVNNKGVEKPWISQDIGQVTIKGSSSLGSDGVMTVKGAGVIKDTTDSFQFTYQKLDGDGELSARIDKFARFDQNALSGIMIREELTPGSPTAFIASSYVKADKLKTPTALRFITRTQKDGKISIPAANDKTANTLVNIDMLNYGDDQSSWVNWIKLKRSGNEITAYTSADGVEWTELGTQSFEMAGSVYIGFAVDAAKDTSGISMYNAAKFSNIKLLKGSDK